MQNSPEHSTGKPRTQQAIELTTALISLSHAVKVFAVKWQCIRNKLEGLLSNLTTIEDCEHVSLFNIVEPVLATLLSCNDLAKRCVELTYSGKLLMQSDLDIVSAKLDNHVKSLSDFYSLGLMSHSYAIVVSKPGFSASRDDIRFYVSDLLSRFKICSIEMKKQALVAFNEAVQEDDRYVKIAVEVDGFISFLVRFLDFEELEIQEEAAKAVSVMAGFVSCRGLLINAGIISRLVRVLESGNELSREFGARCLQKLTENSDNAWSVSAHGGVTVLLKICSDDNSSGELINLACWVLKNLAGIEEIKRFMLGEGAISLFMKLARSKDEIAQMSSLDFLQVMAYGDESVRGIIINKGGIRVLVDVLDPKSPFPSKSRELAIRGIMNTCISSEDSLSMLMSCGFIDHVLYFLHYGEVLVQESGLKATFWLCGTSDEAKKAMGDTGFMPVLVKLLDSKSFEIREMAAETLCSMLTVPKNRRRFVEVDQNVGFILQMLDPGRVNLSNEKLLLSILLSLTMCNSARKKIANSGFLKNIEKLAEAEVSDAKKIVRKLSSTNRFRNILNGIWHSS